MSGGLPCTCNNQNLHSVFSFLKNRFWKCLEIYSFRYEKAQQRVFSVISLSRLSNFDYRRYRVYTRAPYTPKHFRNVCSNLLPTTSQFWILPLRKNFLFLVHCSVWFVVLLFASLSTVVVFAIFLCLFTLN